jgi:molybdate transport system substrate-binding protein
MQWFGRAWLALLVAATAGMAALSGEVVAARATVAVAGNFVIPARALSKRFEALSGHEIRLINGSTGGLYAQIVQGAPVDVFMAADRARPRLLVERGLGLAETRFTYAVGRLVLWGRELRMRDGDGAAILRGGRFTHLAIASPKLAPYGAAAQTVLRRLGVLDALSKKLVYGQNIAQTFQFVATGNAAIGLVALSQMKQGETDQFWVVPAALYDPIRQDAVLLRRGRDNAAAVAFMHFLRGKAARPILESFGYVKRRAP